jgi:nicotinate-nucleotide adenylyltransferase
VRLGIFGGSFDPVHLGHLLLAECCREACGLDQVRFVPAGDPPHKSTGTLASGTARAEMLDFATAGIPEFVVDRRELARRGKSYTVDTLSEFAAEEAGRELFFLIGADSLADLPTWREPRRILDLATIVACNRGGDPPAGLDAVVSQLGPGARDRIVPVEMPAVDLSSTGLRERVRAGRSIRFRVPRAVEAYLDEHGLYREMPAGERR